jgi:hypothetical protein
MSAHNFHAELGHHDTARIHGEVARVQLRGFEQQLEAISGDPSGTPLDEYLGSYHIEKLEAFRDEAERRGWPNSQPIEMYVKRGGRMIWDNPEDGIKVLPLHSPLRRHTVYEKVLDTVGYKIAEMQVDAQKVPVYLCRDGLLRCERSAGAFKKSYGSGYGVLPHDANITLLQAPSKAPKSGWEVVTPGAPAIPAVPPSPANPRGTPAISAIKPQYRLGGTTAPDKSLDSLLAGYLARR